MYSKCPHLDNSRIYILTQGLQEGGGEPPRGPLFRAIETQFGSLESLKQMMNAEGAALQGSGWVATLQRSILHLLYRTFGLHRK